MRQQECEAERNADSTREYLQQIDTLQVRSAFWRNLITLAFLHVDPKLARYCMSWPARLREITGLCAVAS